MLEYNLSRKPGENVLILLLRMLWAELRRPVAPRPVMGRVGESRDWSCEGGIVEAVSKDEGLDESDEYDVFEDAVDTIEVDVVLVLVMYSSSAERMNGIIRSCMPVSNLVLLDLSKEKYGMETYFGYFYCAITWDILVGN